MTNLPKDYEIQMDEYSPESPSSSSSSSQSLASILDTEERLYSSKELTASYHKGIGVGFGVSFCMIATLLFLAVLTVVRDS